MDISTKTENSIERPTEAIEIPGKMIIATIDTMQTFGETFGAIGMQVLRDYGIEKLEEEAMYPTQLRNDIHEAAFNRFGEISLTAFGFKHAEKIHKGGASSLAAQTANK